MQKLFDLNIEKEICKQYEEGLNTKKLGEQYNCSDATILNTLKKHNITRRTGGHSVPDFNELYFDNIDSEKKAYFLGLIAADGSIYQPGRGGQQVFSLELIEEDNYLIYALCEAIEFPISRVKTYSRPNRKNTSKLVIPSNIFTNTLKTYGIQPHKCKTFTIPELPQDLIRHFLRGLVDGDGSISKYRLNLTSGNILLLEQVKEHYIKNLSVNPDALKIYQTGSNCWTLYVNRQLERLQILNYLYENSNIKMERKAQYQSNLVY